MELWRWVVGGGAIGWEEAWDCEDGSCVSGSCEPPCASGRIEKSGWSPGRTPLESCVLTEYGPLLRLLLSEVFWPEVVVEALLWYCSTCEP